MAVELKRNDKWKKAYLNLKNADPGEVLQFTMAFDKPFEEKAKQGKFGTFDRYAYGVTYNGEPCGLTIDVGENARSKRILVEQLNKAQKGDVVTMTFKMRKSEKGIFYGFWEVNVGSGAVPQHPTASVTSTVTTDKTPTSLSNQEREVVQGLKEFFTTPTNRVTFNAKCDELGLKDEQLKNRLWAGYIM